jgi:hypothetical protein
VAGNLGGGAVAKGRVEQSRVRSFPKYQIYCRLAAVYRSDRNSTPTLHAGKKKLAGNALVLYDQHALLSEKPVHRVTLMKQLTSRSAQRAG